MHIFLGADHRGFKLKEELGVWLRGEGYEVEDMGNKIYDAEDDFPDFALKVAEKVARGKGSGILICGSGGMAITANKVKGIRAVEADDEERAKHAKSHDHANILTLPADALEFKKAKRVVKAWLVAPLKSEAKYLRRLKKINDIEANYFK